MVEYKILYSKLAQKDAKKLSAANLQNKAKELIETIKKDPFQNPPPYEKLVGNLSGAYSRRINKIELLNTCEDKISKNR